MSSRTNVDSPEPEDLRPTLHSKIERMTEEQLNVLNKVMLQIEAEELADRIGVGFDNDRAEGKSDRISELVERFRSTHPYQ